jgi:hypothetical protein
MGDVGFLHHGAEAATLPALGATDGESCGGDDGAEDYVGDDHFYL